MRRALQRAAVNDLTRADWRVLGAVLTLTASYSRTVDFVFVADVARLAGLKTERSASRSIGRLIRFGVIEWEPGRGRGQPSLLSLPPKGKGGPTVVVLSDEKSPTTVSPAFEELLAKKPDRRMSDIRWSDTREGVREDNRSGAGRSGTTRPAPTDWVCEELLKDGDRCGSTFPSESALERHKTEAHWNLGELGVDLMREMPA
jgi:hypothetical protein